jgi:hypothetical protein
MPKSTFWLTVFLALALFVPTVTDMPEVFRFGWAALAWAALAVAGFFLLRYSDIPLPAAPKRFLSLIASLIVICGALVLLAPHWRKLSRTETMNIPPPFVPTRRAYWTQGYGTLSKYRGGLIKSNSRITTGSITGAPCGNVQVGGSNNQATTNCGSIPFRVLTDQQRQGIIAFVKTLPESVKITVGTVDGSGDAANYAGLLFPLF